MNTRHVTPLPCSHATAHQILAMVAEGKTQKEIMAETGLTAHQITSIRADLAWQCGFPKRLSEWPNQYPELRWRLIRHAGVISSFRDIESHYFADIPLSQ